MNIPICAKDPEFDADAINDPASASYAQYNYIFKYLNDAEQAILTPGNGYQDYFDVNAMVNYYLVAELMKNADAQINSSSDDAAVDKFTSSVFLYKPRGGKLNFGPLWDFDLSSGNINYAGNEDPTGWYIRDSEWHKPLFEHSDFGQRVHARWCELKREGTVTNLPAQVDRIVASIDPAAIERNFAKWDILGKDVYSSYFIGQTYREETEYLKTWLANRAAWMDAALTDEFGPCPAN